MRFSAVVLLVALFGSAANANQFRAEGLVASRVGCSFVLLHGEPLLDAAIDAGVPPQFYRRALRTHRALEFHTVVSLRSFFTRAHSDVFRILADVVPRYGTNYAALVRDFVEATQLTFSPEAIEVVAGALQWVVGHVGAGQVIRPLVRANLLAYLTRRVHEIARTVPPPPLVSASGLTPPRIGTDAPEGPYFFTPQPPRVRSTSPQPRAMELWTREEAVAAFKAHRLSDLHHEAFLEWVDEQEPETREFLYLELRRIFEHPGQWVGTRNLGNGLHDLLVPGSVVRVFFYEDSQGVRVVEGSIDVAQSGLWDVLDYPLQRRQIELHPRRP